MLLNRNSNNWNTLKNIQSILSTFPIGFDDLHKHIRIIQTKKNHVCLTKAICSIRDLFITK